MTARTKSAAKDPLRALLRSFDAPLRDYFERVAPYANPANNGPPPSPEEAGPGEPAAAQRRRQRLLVAAIWRVWRRAAEAKLRELDTEEAREALQDLRAGDGACYAAMQDIYFREGSGGGRPPPGMSLGWWWSDAQEAPLSAIDVMAISEVLAPALKNDRMAIPLIAGLTTKGHDLYKLLAWGRFDKKVLAALEAADLYDPVALQLIRGPPKTEGGVAWDQMATHKYVEQAEINGGKGFVDSGDELGYDDDSDGGY